VGICKPFDGQAARGGNGIMIAFVAPSKEAVQAAHAAGLANGGSDEGAPGMRPPEGNSFYGAYMRDPAGNKLCLFHLAG
jgi:predicted lactoylglutathione lyase